MSDSSESDSLVCPQCGLTLPFADFHRNQWLSARRAYYCRRCAAERSEQIGRSREVEKQRRPSAEVPPGTKWCPDCDTVKPVQEFTRTRASATACHCHCWPCHNARGRASLENRGGSREYPLHRRYGSGQIEFDELLAAQDGRCAICGGPDPEHLHHDHRTGWVRGILCFNCNGGLGQFRDSPDFLAQAITYLKGTTWQRVLIHPGVYQMCSPMRGRPPSRSS